MLERAILDKEVTSSEDARSSDDSKKGRSLVDVVKII